MFRRCIPHQLRYRRQAPPRQHAAGTDHSLMSSRCSCRSRQHPRRDPWIRLFRYRARGSRLALRHPCYLQGIHGMCEGRKSCVKRTLVAEVSGGVGECPPRTAPHAVTVVHAVGRACSTHPPPPPRTSSTSALHTGAAVLAELGKRILHPLRIHVRSHSEHSSDHEEKHED